MKAVLLALAVCLAALPAQAKYSGGTGEPNDPYQITTAEDLMQLGNSPRDYDKHFILTADIDLNPNLPGRKVFEKAVIAPDTDQMKGWFQGTAFTGALDGNGHTISHLTINGVGYLGLFGQLFAAEVKDLGIEDASITGSGSYVAGLVGENNGSIATSYSTGTVTGNGSVGGLVGLNGNSITTSYSTGTVNGQTSVGGLIGSNWGNVATSYSTGTVTGNGNVGGLVGNSSWTASITASYSTGMVTGSSEVGGLAGFNWGSITTSYNTGTVNGSEYVGGLVGKNGGNISTSYNTGVATGNLRVGGLVGFNGGGDLNGCIAGSYSSGPVRGTSAVGGLAGYNGGGITISYSTGRVTGDEYVGGLAGRNYGSIITCFWDMETSGQSSSAGGTGLTTAEMHNIETYVNAGWDFVDESLNGTCDYWQISPGDYPRLRCHTGDDPLMPEGLGTTDAPYLIRDARDLGTVWLEPTAHYRLEMSVDLSGIAWSMAAIPWFGGTLDGKGQTISHLTITGVSYLGLFGQLGDGAKVSNLGLEAVDVDGIGNTIGGLAGENGYRGSIATSYSTGTVSGTSYAVGGLVGSNLPYSSIAGTYSTATVTGDRDVGGLVGWNWSDGNIANSYSTGRVTGNALVGGLVGRNYGGIVSCFWDMQTSGQVTSAGGTGKTTAAMQTASTFYGWISCEPIWTIDEGNDYPRLLWENKPGEILKPVFLSDVLSGAGTQDNPYLIDTPEDLNLVGLALCDWDKHFKLTADIDLSGFSYSTAPIAPDMSDTENGFQGTAFTGVFDGNGHTISHLTIDGESYLGLFGQVGPGGKITYVHLEAVDVSGTGDFVGCLVGYSSGNIATSHSTGAVTGNGYVGGLVGNNRGTIATSYGTAAINATEYVGGLVGFNCEGTVTRCYSTGSVDGQYSVGGLVGSNGNDSSITSSYSTGAVVGQTRVGGLVGENELRGSITMSYSAGKVNGVDYVGGLVGRNSRGKITQSFWDVETSGQATSAGGTGRTTAEMQTASTFYGWIRCGEEPIWTIDEANDYPRLYWENKPGEIFGVLSLSGLLSGSGTQDDPYLIHTSEELNLIGLALCDWDKCFQLMADIDLSAFSYDAALIAWDTDDTENGFQGIPFTGVFDGNGHTISHLTIDGESYLGLFGQVGPGGRITNLHLEAVNVNGRGGSIGGLTGLNIYGSIATTCSMGVVSGDGDAGGLVGDNFGNISASYSSASVSGTDSVCGLVGRNGGDVRHCYSTGAVNGKQAVGGLVGSNIGPVGTATDCYSTGAVDGTDDVGGLVGSNGAYLTRCYSTGAVRGAGNNVGGLLGGKWASIVTACFWDVQTSGQSASVGGTGKTTAAMQTDATFLDARWDFVDETTNGTEDIWWINQGKDYPHLWWELILQN